MLMPSVHAMRSAVFGIVCCFVMLVVGAVGDQIVEAYSSIGLITELYVESMSLSVPIGQGKDF